VSGSPSRKMSKQLARERSMAGGAASGGTVACASSRGGVGTSESGTGTDYDSSDHSGDETEDEGFGFAPRFVRDNLCYQCSLNPAWYLRASWHCAQAVSFLVVAMGIYLCVMYHAPKHSQTIVPVVSYITLWNGLLATGFCFWPSHAVHRSEGRNSRSGEDLGFLLGAMFVFSNLTVLLSKLLHSTADQPVTEWEDKTPLNLAAVVSFMLGACLLSVLFILFVFLSDFMPDDNDEAEDEGGGEEDEAAPPPPPPPEGWGGWRAKAGGKNGADGAGDNGDDTEGQRARLRGDEDEGDDQGSEGSYFVNQMANWSRWVKARTSPQKGQNSNTA